MDGELCDEESPRRCHECFPEYSPQTFFLRKRFIQAQFGLVDLFVAPSAMLRDRYVAWGVPEERILLEDYGRRLPAAPPPDDERVGPRDRLGFFGQLNPYKGIDVLLEAMRRQAPDGGAQATLRVHGANLDLQEHGFRDRVEAMLAETRDRVIVAGEYAPDQVAPLMAAVDWVVVPSVWWENSPLVIQEGFAHGRPVICSDVGGMAEKVADGVNGLHFRVGDPASLAETIGRAVGTPGLWERLRAGIPRPHAMEDHVAVLTAAYERLLAGASRRTAS
jgi:glycosyltransferase involved in cell wall biosynthesis